MDYINCNTSFLKRFQLILNFFPEMIFHNLKNDLKNLIFFAEIIFYNKRFFLRFGKKSFKASLKIFLMAVKNHRT